MSSHPRPMSKSLRPPPSAQLLSPHPAPRNSVRAPATPLQIATRESRSARKFPSASATSSLVSPPNSRSSTIRLFRASIRSRLSSASSKPHQGLRAGQSGHQRGLQRHVRRPASALFRQLRPRMIHQNPSHDLCRQREELAPVFPCVRPHLHQPQIRFVHQGGGLQRARVRFARQVCPRDPLQLVDHRRHQRVQRRAVPARPCLQQLRDIGAGLHCKKLYQPHVSLQPAVPLVSAWRIYER